MKKLMAVALLSVVSSVAVASTEAGDPTTHVVIKEQAPKSRAAVLSELKSYQAQNPQAVSAGDATAE